MASLDDLPQTDSGHIPKDVAMNWWSKLDTPSDSELRDAVIPKPKGFTGSAFATEVSQVRVTGDPEFIERVAGLLRPLQEFEDSNTRVELNLQETEDRDTGELTGNYALYLSVAERA